MLIARQSPMAAFNPTALVSTTIEDAIIELTFLATKQEDELVAQDPNYIRKINLSSDFTTKTISGSFSLSADTYLNSEGKIGYDAIEFLPEPTGSGYGS